jgi:small-conductance mechanosensitive channel
MVRHMFTALALLPMIRLTQQGARSNSIRGPYVLGILFTLDAVRQAFAGAPLLEQGILLLEALSGMVLVGWLLASGHLRRLHEEGIGMLRLQKLRALGWLVLLTLSGGLAGGVFGYLRFARLLLSGLWAGGVLALVLYCLLRVLSGLVAFSLHVRPLRRLRMVQSHRGFLEHRTHRVLAWAAICAWVYPREQGAYQARGRHHRAQRPTGHGASDNWTLSDRMRRLELPVGINYGAAPQKVIEVLEKVALKHPHVLHHPPPQALLTAYGDSSINFELRVWTDELDDWAKIRSDLAVALYDAIQEAGMQFPFPQREVRLLQDSPENAAKVT